MKFVIEYILLLMISFMWNFLGFTIAIAFVLLVLSLFVYGICWSFGIEFQPSYVLWVFLLLLLFSK